MTEPTTPPQIPAPKAPEYSIKATWEYLRAFAQDVLYLEKGVDKRETINEIKNKKSMAGANAWMLICSIMIASIGLSQNSQAVIIGGMLISPLMSPILGIGLSVAINDMETLRTSVAHFAVAIVIALVSSTLYFKIFYFIEATNEILARTEPTFLDIFVAIFGGMAGIISIARKDISTTLPGVAIATALMPPLCVSGFGLAHGNWEIATRSFYLFFLNTFFVSLSTYVVVRLLQFPYKKYVKKADKRRNNVVIILFSLLVTVPSYQIFRGVLDDLMKKRQLNEFQTKCLGDHKKLLDSYQLEKNDSINDILFLKVYGLEINQNNIPQYQSCLEELGMKNTDIRIISSTDVDLDQVQSIEKNLEEISHQINEEEQQQIATLEKYSLQYVDSSYFAQLSSELKVLFPEITEISLAKMPSSDFDTYHPNLTTLLIRWKNPYSRSKKTKEQKIYDYAKERIATDTLRVISY